MTDGVAPSAAPPRTLLDEVMAAEAAYVRARRGAIGGAVSGRHSASAIIPTFVVVSSRSLRVRARHGEASDHHRKTAHRHHGAAGDAILRGLTPLRPRKKIDDQFV